MTRREHDPQIKHLGNERYILTCADCGRIHARGSRAAVEFAQRLMLHQQALARQRKRGVSHRMRTARRARRKAAA